MGVTSQSGNLAIVTSRAVNTKNKTKIEVLNAIFKLKIATNKN